MELEKSIEKIDLKSNGIISIEQSIIDETFKNKLAYDTIGAHDIDEFNNRAFYYIDWNSNENSENFNGYRCTYAILRYIQKFVVDLWNIKDNNIYVFSGFLFEYEQTITDGSTFKGTLASTTSKANLDKAKTTFTKSEIESAITKIVTIDINNLLEQESDYFTPTSEHFFKSEGINRISRASYFVHEARIRHTYPTKIVSYITAFECLFTTSQVELSHSVSERVATFKGGTKEHKIATYKLLKKAYDVRSKMVHGSVLKGKNEDLIEITTGLDQLLRNFLSEKNEIFTKSNEEIDYYFLDQFF